MGKEERKSEVLSTRKLTKEEEKIFKELVKIAKDFEIDGKPAEIKTPQDNIYGDVGFDSLGGVEFCMHLEHKMKIKFKTKDIANFMFVYDIIDEIKKIKNIQ